MKPIYINTDFIKLDTFLKLSGVVATGGQAKQLILSGQVKVNGVGCLERGKKIRDKDTIEYNSTVYEVRKTECKTDHV